MDQFLRVNERLAIDANLGLIPDHFGPWSGALRLRYFGPRPLIEDNSVCSSASALSGEASNPAGCADGTSGAYDDWHVHPSEPRTFRITVSYRF